jgi:tryptophan synthase beta subunit
MLMVIGEEARAQIQEAAGRLLDELVACVGGSNVSLPSYPVEAKITTLSPEV